MKSIRINGIDYNPRHVLSVDVNGSEVLITLVNKEKWRLMMPSNEAAMEFKYELLNNW